MGKNQLTDQEVKDICQSLYEGRFTYFVDRVIDSHQAERIRRALSNSGKFTFFYEQEYLNYLQDNTIGVEFKSPGWDEAHQRSLNQKLLDASRGYTLEQIEGAFKIALTEIKNLMKSKVFLILGIIVTLQSCSSSRLIFHPIKGCAATQAWRNTRDRPIKNPRGSSTSTKYIR